MANKSIINVSTAIKIQPKLAKSSLGLMRDALIRIKRTNGSLEACKEKHIVLKKVIFCITFCISSNASKEISDSKITFPLSLNLFPEGISK